MTAWERAACLSHAPQLFDSVNLHESGERRRIDTAIQVCGRCPIVAACLAEARRCRDDGVRGGVLLERGKPVRLPAAGRSRLQPCGTRAAYRRHQKRGEVPCPRCRSAVADARQQSRLRRPA